MITEKNKKEIEKILKGCGIYELDDGDKCECTEEYLCDKCEGLKQATIKTSIEWCEAWLETFRTSSDWNALYYTLLTHLTYLKEQEEEL